MAKVRKKKARRGRPRILGPSAPTSPGSVVPSLPPALPEAPLQVVSNSDRPTERPPVGDPARSWWLPDDSLVRAKALQILAMRISGLEDKDIAAQMGISPNSISSYVYRATKNGWLNIDYDPKERLKMQTIHKIVERIEEGLDDGMRMNTGMMVRTATALKMVDIMSPSLVDQQIPEAGNTIVAVQVVMPEGPRQTVREETTGGTPAFIEAESCPTTK